MDELKDLIIQALESKGVLGNIRAQLRSCVFKCIDDQDRMESGQSSFHFDNPLARKATETSVGKIGVELIREFLEYYKMDYTLNVFGPETNMMGKTEDKDELARKAGCKEGSKANKPVLI